MAKRLSRLTFVPTSSLSDQDEIVWQCNNGGTLYNATIANLTATDASYIAATDTGTKIPSQFCR